MGGIGQIDALEMRASSCRAPYAELVLFERIVGGDSRSSVSGARVVTGRSCVSVAGVWNDENRKDRENHSQH